MAQTLPERLGGDDAPARANGTQLAEHHVQQVGGAISGDMPLTNTLSVGKQTSRGPTGPS